LVGARAAAGLCSIFQEDARKSFSMSEGLLKRIFFIFLIAACGERRSVLKFDPETQAPFSQAQTLSSAELKRGVPTISPPPRRVGMNYCKLKSVYTMSQNKRSARCGTGVSAPAAPLFYIIIVACCGAKIKKIVGPFLLFKRRHAQIYYTSRNASASFIQSHK
jgi:hypothetical protein